MSLRELNIWNKSCMETAILSTPGALIDNTNILIAHSMAKALEHTFLKKFSDYPVFGFSACQIAKCREEVLQMFFLRENGKNMVFANPKVIESSETKIVSRMYCCSTDGGERILLLAPVYIVLQFLDIYSGETFQRVFNHPTTASIVHELSHLEGKKIEVDMIPGTNVCKGDMLKNFNDDEKTKILLGDHFLNQYYSKGGKILVIHSEGRDVFLLQDGNKIPLN